MLDDEGRPKLERVQRDRPLIKLHHVFNVEQTEGLQLRSLQTTAGPEWEGHERAEALIRASGVRVDHVAGDRAYYNLKDDRVVLPERSQFPSQDAYTHTALHDLGHATGHPSRLNRPTLVNHGGFGTETYAREELRAEIAAMMTGEQLGVGHEPRHGTAYVSSRIEALKNDPKEIRAAAVDAQRISDWLLARERERSVADERAVQERPAAGGVPAQGHEHGMAPGPGGGAAATRDAPAVSEKLKTVLRDVGAAGYRAGYQAVDHELRGDPFQSAPVFLPPGAGRELTLVLEQAHGNAYLRGMHDRQRGFEQAPDGGRASGVQPDAIRSVEAELTEVLREAGAAGYDRGYDDACLDRENRPPSSPRAPGGPWTAGRCGGASRRRNGQGLPARIRRPHPAGQPSGPAVRRDRVDYVREVTAVGERAQAGLRYVYPVDHDAALRGIGRSPQAINPAAAADRQRDTGPSR